MMVCLNGLAMASLFVVGHDACHGSLTPDPRLNNWMASLAFLPSLHTVTGWKSAHNSNTTHGRTIENTIPAFHVIAQRNMEN